MKRALCCISLLVYFTTGILSSQEVHFTIVDTRQSWDSTQKASLETGKPIFVAVHTDWCKYCKLMEQEVYRDEQVSSYFNRFFINIKMDGEKEFGKTFAGLYSIKGFPTLFFMNGSGGVLQRVNGYTEAANILGFARKALQKSDLIPKVESRYQSGVITPAEMMVYLDFVETTDQMKAISMANDYLEGLDSLPWTDSSVFSIISHYALDPGRKIPEEALRNRKLLEQLYGAQALEDYFGTLYSHHLDRAISMEDDSLVELIFPLTALFFLPEEQEATRAGTWKIFYAETENASGYERVVMEASASAEDAAEFFYQEAYEIAMDYPDYHQFPDIANRLIDLFLKLKGEDFDGYYLKAYIITLMDDSTGASGYALKCKALASGKQQQELADKLLLYIENIKAPVPMEIPVRE